MRKKFVGGVLTLGTHEDERTVLYKTISLDGTKPNTNHKTNIRHINPNTNPDSDPDPKLIQILTLLSCFMLFRAPSLVLQSSPNISKTRK